MAGGARHVAVVIPALNEADNLSALLPEVLRLGIDRIVVGDNGSTDGTADVARSHGAEVAGAAQRGYGAACHAALQRLADDIDIVVFLDADQSDDVTLIPALIAPLAGGEADLVIGTRVAALRQRGAMTLPQRWGDRLATALIRYGWGFDYHDLGPFRAVTREALRRIDMQDRAFGWTVEMQIRAVEERLRIQQLPVPYRRRDGRSKISGTIGGVILAGYWILATTWRLYKTRAERTQAA